MEYKYIVVQNTYRTKEKSRIGYGIAAVEEYDGSITVLESVADLSSDSRTVEQLAERCNMLQLDPMQLRDVVNDFLAMV